jgi:hypothetical protein
MTFPGVARSTLRSVSQHRGALGAPPRPLLNNWFGTLEATEPIFPAQRHTAVAGSKWLALSVSMASIVLLAGACSDEPSTFGGPCPAPRPPRTDATTGRYAATYVSLEAPLKAAIQKAESGFIYSSPSKVVRARARAAIATFVVATSRVAWPEAVRADIVSMAAGLGKLSTYLTIENKRDPHSVSEYRGGLDHAASPAYQSDQRIRADLGLPGPVPC